MSDREIERELLTAPARLLLHIYKKLSDSQIERQRDLPWTPLHKEYGSKLYSQAYLLSVLGLIQIYGEGRNKRIKLTEKGYKLAKCLIQCFNNL